MTLRFAFSFAMATLTLVGGAMADPEPAPAGFGNKTIPESRKPGTAAAIAAVVQVADVTGSIAQLAAATSIAAATEPAALEQRTVAEERIAAADEAAMPAASDAPPARLAALGKVSAKPPKHAHVGRHAAAAQPLCVQAVGKSEVGVAAWYGGRYVGRRTSSGERLDTVHATAAHRTLPLNSLVRVTNLDNGRSVVARVTDRGPMNDSLLIDMSPRAADELRMREAGLAQVKVEQVVEVPPDAK